MENKCKNNAEPTRQESVKKNDQFYLHNRVCTIMGGSLLFKSAVKFALSIKKKVSVLTDVHPFVH